MPQVETATVGDMSVLILVVFVIVKKDDGTRLRIGSAGVGANPTHEVVNKSSFTRVSFY